MTESGYRVVRCHYTADPDKDPSTEKGLAWLKEELKGVKGGMSSSAWRKEMEIDFKARSGTKVFPNLEFLQDKIMMRPFEVPDWWKMGSGYDWGKRHPFAYVEACVGVDSDKYVTSGYKGSGFDIPAQSELMKGCKYFKRATPRNADPSIWIETQQKRTGGYTSFQALFSDLDIYFIKGKTSDITAIDRLESYWYENEVLEGKVVKRPRETMELRFFYGMEWLFEELCNLRYAEYSPKTMEVKGPKETIVDVDNDGFDALKYWILSLPDSSVQPKARSKDPAVPMAGELAA